MAKQVVTRTESGTLGILQDTRPLLGLVTFTLNSILVQGNMATKFKKELLENGSYLVIPTNGSFYEINRVEADDVAIINTPPSVAYTGTGYVATSMPTSITVANTGTTDVLVNGAVLQAGTSDSYSLDSSIWPISYDATGGTIVITNIYGY
jgi:hypothetical protein